MGPFDLAAPIQRLATAFRTVWQFIRSGVPHPGLTWPTRVACMLIIGPRLLGDSPHVMRIVATQFGILFALLAFSSQLLAGARMFPSLAVGAASGAAVLLTLLLADALVDRYLRRLYKPDAGVDEAAIDEASPEAARGGESESARAA